MVSDVAAAVVAVVAVVGFGSRSTGGSGRTDDAPPADKAYPPPCVAWRAPEWANSDPVRYKMYCCST